MSNVLYPLTYLGLGPYLIALARALQARHGFQPTYLAATPAEAAFAQKNADSGAVVLALAERDSGKVDVLPGRAEYEAVYGFMKAKHGGSHNAWRERVNVLYHAIERAVLERNIALFIVWNGCDCVGKICGILAQKHAVKILYLENGYFPDTLQVDPSGVNASASICGLSASEWVQADGPLDLKTDPTRPTPVKPLSLLQRLYLKCEARLLPGFHSRYPELRSPPGGKRVKSKLPLGSSAAVLRSGKPFALVVLQVHDDTQLLLNSPLFRHPRDFLVHCYQQIRQVFGPSYPIVVKLHPVDMERICYADLAATMRGVSWIGAEPVQPLLQACGFVMVINSSVGLQSIALHRPTVVFGDSFYSRSELCHVVRYAKDTRKVLGLLKAQGGRKDAGQIDRFVSYLTESYFVPGTWNLKPDSDLTPVLNRIQLLLQKA